MDASGARLVRMLARERNPRGPQPSSDVPTVLRIGSARLFFYANESNEAPHIHIETPCGKAKLWLRPVRVASANGLGALELRRLARIVERHENDLWKAWHGFFGA